MRITFAVIISGALLAGCASLSQEQCQIGDWRAIGFSDGAAGRSLERFAQHQDACARHGVAADLDLYRHGRDEGLQQYCRPERGFQLGLRGGAYAGVCPERLAPVFVEAFGHGRAIYEAQSDIRRAGHDITELHEEIDALEDHIAKAEADLISEGLSRDERADILADIKKYSEKIGAYEQEIVDLEIYLSRRQDELHALKRRSSARY